MPADCGTVLKPSELDDLVSSRVTVTGATRRKVEREGKDDE